VNTKKLRDFVMNSTKNDSVTMFKGLTEVQSAPNSEYPCFVTEQ